MNVLGGVKALQHGGEGPFVVLYIQGSTENLSPARARQLAARLYLAARAAERMAAKEEK